MADIEIGDLQVRLSGGAAETDPNNSLGGIKSSEIVLSQSSTALSNVTGVVIDNVIGAPVGVGTLNFHFVAVAQVQTLTIDGPLITANKIEVDVDGVNVSAVFATDSNTTLAAFATAIQGEAGVVTAVVTDAGGGSDDDREIVITAAVAGTPVVLENENVTLGASQVGIVQAVTTGNQTVDSLRWTPLGGGAVDGVDVSVDGTFTITGSDGSLLVVTVTAASLPGTDQNDSITIANIANEIFDDISKAESAAGDTEYRGLYIHNVHGVDTAFDVRIWLKQDSSGPDAVTMAKDLAGVGDGASTGVMDTIANESTAPSPTLTFTAPSTQATGITLTDLAPAQSHGFWLRRIVPSANTTSAPNAISKIGISALL